MQKLILLLVSIVVGIILFVELTSCNSLRNYNKVASDTTKGFTEPKKFILSKVCNFEFPQKESITEHSDTTINYDLGNQDLCAKAVDSLQKIVSKLSKEERGNLNLDSLFATLEPIIQYKDTTIYKTNTIKVEDSAKIYLWAKVASDALDIRDNEIKKRIMSDTLLNRQTRLNSSFVESKKNTLTVLEWFGLDLIKEAWFWMLMFLLLGGTCLKLFIKLKL